MYLFILVCDSIFLFFFFQAEDGIRDVAVTGVQTCALPISGDVLFVLSALEGFDWVLANRSRYGIRVISNSWGTTGSFSADDPINVASKMAHDAGLVVVFAAGNAGPATNTLNPYCVAPWVICVAAGAKDGKTLADFSSRGIAGDPLYHPTITAPGVNIAAARATTGIVINTFFAVDLLRLGTYSVWYAVARA